ncbi:MAG TPA: VWA domain-containing protein [Bryobacteraceae bacterium]|nr:VWA domain-containing protein [Bryobacteraceae bacterium]
MRRTHIPVRLSAWLILAFSPALVRADSPGGPAEPLFSATSELVLIPVHVLDRKGRTVTHLQREHFQVFDEGEARSILSFTGEDVPVSLGLVLDLSKSMQRKLPDALAALRAITATAGPEDEAFLLAVSSEPEVLAHFTSDVASLADVAMFSKVEGSTALIDSIHLALTRVRSGRNTRKALVVISDGADNHSRYCVSELMAVAQETDTQIYTIAVHEHRHSQAEARGADMMKKISAATGGLHFALQGRWQLPQAGQKIGLALKSVYVLGFRPPPPSTARQWRRVRVKLAPSTDASLRVTARSGYFADE